MRAEGGRFDPRIMIEIFAEKILCVRDENGGWDGRASHSPLGKWDLKALTWDINLLPGNPPHRNDEKVQEKDAKSFTLQPQMTIDKDMGTSELASASEDEKAESESAIYYYSGHSVFSLFFDLKYLEIHRIRKSG